MTDNKRIIERLFAEVWSQGELGVIDEIYSEQFHAHYHHPPKWGDGKAGVKALVTSIRNAFPDYVERIEDLVQESDRVAVRIHITGTHRGSLGRLPPTQRTIAVDEIIIFRLDAGKVVEQWGVPDMLALYEQLGVVNTLPL